MDIEAAKARCAVAPMGPWTWDMHESCIALHGRHAGKAVVMMSDVEVIDDGSDYCVKLLFEDELGSTVFGSMAPYRKGNPAAEFIAHARTDLPDAIKLIEEMEKLLRAVPLFYTPGLGAVTKPVCDAIRDEWMALTGQSEATTKALVDAVIAVLAKIRPQQPVCDATDGKEAEHDCPGASRDGA